MIWGSLDYHSFPISTFLYCETSTQNFTDFKNFVNISPIVPTDAGFLQIQSHITLMCRVLLCNQFQPLLSSLLTKGKVDQLVKWCWLWAINVWSLKQDPVCLYWLSCLKQTDYLNAKCSYSCMQLYVLFYLLSIPICLCTVFLYIYKLHSNKLWILNEDQGVLP